MNEAAREILQEQERVETIKTTVREAFPNVVFPDPIKEPVFFGRLGRERLVGKHAIVDAGSRKVYGICTSDYKIVSHEEAIDIALKAVESLGEYGKPKAEVKFMDAHKAKMFTILTFPEAKEFFVGKDKINPSIYLKNSYDLVWQLQLVFGAFQVICSNGLVAGVIEESMKGRHLSGLNVDAFREQINAGMSNFSDQIGLWNDWAEKRIGLPMYDLIAEKLPFSDKEKEKLLSLHITGREEGENTLKALQEQNNMTLWDLHSASTQLLSHDIRSEKRRVEDTERIATLFNRIN